MTTPDEPTGLPRPSSAWPASLENGSELGRRIITYDWSKTPLGSIEGWPESLRAVVRVVVDTSVPMCVFWGATLVQIYNDAYLLIARHKHPEALGAPCHESWPEREALTRPHFDTVFQSGRAHTVRDLPYPVARRDFLEEISCTTVYSPLRCEGGEVGGVLVTLQETTKAVVRERRLRLLSELGAFTSEGWSVEATCRAVIEPLSRALADIPFALVYLADDEGGAMRLAGSVHMGAAQPSAERWPLAAAGVVQVDDVRRRLGALPPGMPHLAEVDTALVIPMADPSLQSPAGSLVVGVSPRLPLDDEYREFLRLTATHVAMAIARARAFADKRAGERAAQALAESEARFRNMADHAPVMLWVTGPDGRCTYLNQQWYDFTGQAREIEPGFRWLSAVHPDDARRAAAIFLAANAKHAAFRLEYRLRRKDGEYRWAIDSADPRFGPQGEFLGYIGSVIDITERKHAEELERRAAEAERERLRAHLLQAPVAICILRGPNFVFEVANPLYARVVGRPAESLLGRSFRAVFSELPDDAPLFAVLENVYKSGQAFSADEYLVSLDRHGKGTLENAWFQFTCEPMRNAAGQVDSLIAVGVDVTAQVLARKRVEALAWEREGLLARESAARAQAEEANRLKDEFLSTLSHELRTPLTSILGWVQLLKSGSLPPEKRERAIKTIERGARAQRQLIEDLLDVSSIMSGKLRLVVEPVGMNALIEQALETMRPAADAKGIKLQAAVDSLCTVMGDKHRLEQVVWNLLSNAVKFTPKGGRVQIFVERRDSSVELTVADTGQGIPKDFAPHLFERFRQADGSTKRQHGGLGLGLAIVKHLVEMHGGTVAAFSEGEGRGATFRVRLPLPVALRREVALPPALQVPALSQDFKCTPEFEGTRILVVDDEADARELVRTLLEHCKAEVMTAGSAEEGLALLKAQRPHLLVSDIGMPGVDGYALIQQVRALPESEGGETPAVALTAYARVQDRTRVLLAGFNSYVPKPVEPLELLAVLASLRGRKGDSPSTRPSEPSPRDWLLD